MKHLDKTNWERVKFGDVARSLNTTVRDLQAAGIERVVGLEHIDSGSLHIKSWGNIAAGTTFTRTFQPEQVLFGKRRAYQRKAAVADFAGLCSGDILVLEAKNDRLLSKLLPFLVHSDGFFDHAVRTSAGSLSPRTKFQDLAEYEFLLPPRDQQARLAELLWAADEVEETQKQVRQQANSYASLFTDGAFGSPDSFFTFHELTSLQNYCLLQTGVAKGKKYSTEEEVVSLPYLRVANVQDGYVDLTEIKEIEIAEREIQRFSLKSGDVLLTEGGDFDKLGRGAVWYAEIEDCLHQNHVFCVRPDQSKLLPEFVSAQTGSSYGKAYFLINAKKTSNLASINSTQVKQFPMIVPPLKEQEAFIDKLSDLKKAVDEMTEAINQASMLKHALINQIFSA